MMMLAALALAASAPVSLDDQIDSVCGYALESVISQDEKSGYEVYVGRMEIRMMDLGYDDGDKTAMRLMCKSYLLGSRKGMEIFGRQAGFETTRQ